MELHRDTKSLTHKGVLMMLGSAVAEAEKISRPQCIVIVDASGELLGEIRMTGAKFLSRKSARAKALTAASTGRASNTVPEAVRNMIGLATEGSITGLPGGLPVIIEGHLVGGIGVGSGTGEEDIQVALAALMAVGAETGVAVTG